jgi:hypothetical protein
MSFNVSAQVGSGTIPFVRGILPAEQRGNQSNGEGIRTGAQVVLANPEDLNSVDAFAVSGISIGPTPVLIWSPNINPLPRQRTLVLQNQGPGSVYIGPNSTSVIAPSGYHIHPPAASPGNNVNAKTELELPFLKNVEIWARADGGSGASIVIIAY